MRLLTDQLRREEHEHPHFNGQWHTPVWVKTWVSTGTNDEPPDDAPISCAICGRIYGK